MIQKSRVYIGLTCLMLAPTLTIAKYRNTEKMDVVRLASTMS